jgi:single-stranded DNA-specific DHH superfamily exonuclease
MSKYYVLAHFDLDGIISTINVYQFKRSFDNFQYCLTGYTSLDKKIKNLNREEFDVLWILDLNLTQEHIKNIYEVFVKVGAKQVIWIDHHSYSYDVKAEIFKYGNDPSWCIFHYEKDKCAALLTNEFLHDNLKDTKKWKEVTILSEITNIYDMWKTSDTKWKRAYNLNDLFWEYGYEKFFTKFKDGYFLDTEEFNTMDKIDADRTEYVKNTINKYLIHNEKCKAVYIYNPECKYPNHFTLALSDVDYYVILKEHNTEFYSYSIRLYNYDVDLTVHQVFDIIKKAGVKVILCGGHDRVGSITIPPSENEKFLETINNFFEGKL